MNKWMDEKINGLMDKWIYYIKYSGIPSDINEIKALSQP